MLSLLYVDLDTARYTSVKDSIINISYGLGKQARIFPFQLFSEGSVDITDIYIYAAIAFEPHSLSKK